jgi:uncharacterized membrane protein
VYPTITNGALTIIHPKANTNSSLSIFNLNGNKVSAINLQEGSQQSLTDVTKLVSGIYILQFNDGTKVLKTKFVKQ